MNGKSNLASAPWRDQLGKGGKKGGFISTALIEQSQFNWQMTLDTNHYSHTLSLRWCNGFDRDLMAFATKESMKESKEKAGYAQKAPYECPNWPWLKPEQVPFMQFSQRRTSQAHVLASMRSSDMTIKVIVTQLTIIDFELNSMWGEIEKSSISLMPEGHLKVIPLGIRYREADTESEKPT